MSVWWTSHVHVTLTSLCVVVGCVCFYKSFKCWFSFSSSSRYSRLSFYSTVSTLFQTLFNHIYFYIFRCWSFMWNYRTTTIIMLKSWVSSHSYKYSCLLKIYSIAALQRTCYHISTRALSIVKEVLLKITKNAFLRHHEGKNIRKWQRTHNSYITEVKVLHFVHDKWIKILTL